jgi:hypothetical protein
MIGLTVAKMGVFLGVYTFRRSDGRLFFMHLNQDGSASVFAGVHDRLPQDPIGVPDVNVSDKVERAKALILSYKR